MSIRLEALPDMQAASDQLVAKMAAQGVTIVVSDFGGFRTAADTAEILNDRDADYAVYLANGGDPIDENTWRPIAPYEQSLHDYGAARDWTIQSKPSSMSGLAAVALLDSTAEGLGLRTGASYGDPLHTELPISVADAAAAWNDYVAAGGAAPSSSSAATTAAFAIVGLSLGVFVVAKYAKGLKQWN